MSGVANNVQGSTIFSGNTVTGGPNDVVVRDLLVENNLTITNAFVAQAIIVEDGTFTNDVQVDGEVNCDGNITAGGTVSASNGASITGDSYLNGDAFVDQTMFATDASVSGSIVIGDNTPSPPAPGTLEVLTVYGDADISGTLTVNGGTVTGPAGTVANAIQRRSATGALDADDDFIIESAPKRLRINATTQSNGTQSGAIVNFGGMGMDGNLYSNGLIKTANTTAATGVANGCITGAGGLGIGGDAYFGGLARVLNTTGSTGYTNGSLVVSGGMGVAENLFTNGIIRTTATTTSTGVGNGALVSGGGLGVAGTAFIGGDVRLNSATSSTSSATGALRVVGGVGIGENAVVAGRLVVRSDQTESEVTAVIGQNILDDSVNGTTSGTAYNILGMRDPVRTWYMGTDGTNSNQFYFGAQSTPAGNPDYMFMYTSSGQFAVLGLNTGVITAPTALFTVRGSSSGVNGRGGNGGKLVGDAGVKKV
jgi:cytoskeletal protein CcmA (bactofilin family)